MIGQQVSGCEIILRRTVEITVPQKVQKVSYIRKVPQTLRFWKDIVTFHSDFQQAFLSNWWLNSDLEMNSKLRHPNAMLKTNRPTKMQQTEGGKPFDQISKCSKTNKPNRVYIPCAATHTELRSQRHPLKMMIFLGRFMDEARHFQTLIT